MATLTNSYQYIGRTSCKSQNGGGSYYLLLHAKSIPNKKTGIHTVYVKGILASNYGSYYGYPSTSTGKIDGTQVYNNSKKPSSAWSGKNSISSTLGGGTAFNQSFTLGENSKEVDCTNGKSKEITVEVYYKFTGSGDTYTPNQNAEMKVSTKVVLPAIERTATITAASDFDDTKNPTITFTNPLGADATLQAAIAVKNSAGTWMAEEVPYRTITNTSTTYTFPLSDEERDALRARTPNSNSLNIAFYLKTIIGTVELKHSVEKKMNIVDANPTASIAVTEKNPKVISLLNNSTSAEKVILGASQIEVKATPSAKKSASVKTISLTCGNTTVNNPANNTYTFNGITGTAVSYSVTDSRGNVGTGTKTLSSLPYNPIVIKSFECKRKDLDHPKNVVISLEADCFSGSFEDKENTFTVSYTLKGITTNLRSDEFVVASNTLQIKNLDLGEIVTEDEVVDFSINISDLCMDISKKTTIILLTPTFEAGQNDFQVNGTLYIADKAGKNAKSLLDYVYPIGSYYISTKSKSPAEIYGGSWTRLQGRFLLAGHDSEDAYKPGQKGGKVTVSLSTAEMPSHTHTRGTMDITGEIELRPMNTGDDNPILGCTGAFSLTKETWSGSHDCFQKVSVAGKQINHAVFKASNSWSGATSATGSGSAHENMPPFLAVYMWERTG